MGLKLGTCVAVKRFYSLKSVLSPFGSMATFETLKFDNLALRTLPLDSIEENYVRNVSGACFSHVPLAPLEKPTMMSYSMSAAELFDLPNSELERDEAAEYLSGSKHWPGTELAAHCYCGHQFGYFAGQLGDGAVKYLGEMVNHKGERWEIQLKGAGPTPYSRDADGRKVLRSSIREYLCSEAMHHLGIPTTRALSCVTSETRVMRDIFYSGNPIMEKCTVVSRLAPTFLRFGSFEIFKPLDPLTGRVAPSVGRDELLVKLLHYTISTFYREIYDAFSDDIEKMYTEFFKKVVEVTARLVADWQCVGFCHGVLNTDNMSIVGLTIDYGPYGFMDRFSPDHICNNSDDGGRYSYVNQPKMCAWNLNKLAEALQKVLPLDISQKVLDKTYSTEYNKHYLKKMRKKLGLIQELPEDSDLIVGFMTAMESTGSDFTNSFRGLSKLSLPGCSDFDQSLEVTKEYLLSQCCSVEELRYVNRPTMDDSHFKVFVTLLSQHPEILEQLGKGVSAIQREVEKRKKFEELKTLTSEAKQQNDRKAWEEWLKIYTERLQRETEDAQDIELLNKERKSIMNATNPKFILRNYIAQVAIEAAEKGDYSEVNKILGILENPFSEMSTSDYFMEDQRSGSLTDPDEDRDSQHVIVNYDAPPPKWARCLKVSCSS